ncbi:MAG TPA: glycosyltransferase 87 family protein [Thermoanaerobaculia bacterium]|nr:glycosyltransferase 87 family protein [Thermoanaerobaculia bacterium]
MESRRGSPAQLVPIVAGYAGLLLVWDFEARPLLFLLLVAGTFVALWRFSRASGSEIPLRTLLLVAAVSRALLVPVPASLSDDVYRYLWDGRVALAGFDPYRLAPDDPTLEPLRERAGADLREPTAHRDVETVYPPVAIALFAVAASSPFELWAWKGMMALFDLGSCWLVWQVARRTGRPTASAIWYAWNPLAAIESAAMGHVDAAGVCALLAALYGLLSLGGPGEGERRVPRPVVAGALTAAGALVKLVPLVLVPLFLLRARSAAFTLALIAVLAAGLAPMVLPSQGPPPGLVRYGISWEFNGPLFEPLWRAIEAAGVAPDVKGTLDTIRSRVAGSGPLEALYPYVYPQLLAKAALVLGLACVLLLGMGVRDLLDATFWTLAGALLLSATFYPWYALWALPFAALRRSAPWLVLSLSLQAAYLPRLFGWSAWPTAWLVVWMPVVLTAAVAAARRRSARHRAPRAAGALR